MMGYNGLKCFSYKQQTKREASLGCAEK